MPLPSYLSLIYGDLTQRPVDAIVNAANSRLLGGGGVDGAIHSAAGFEKLMEACSRLGGCPTGEVKATAGFNLQARWILHAVGPVWQGGEKREPALLASAYRRSLEEAVNLGCSSIAFPAISCGVYGYPFEKAAAVARNAIKVFQAGPSPLQLVELVFIEKDSLEQTRQVWEAV